MVLRAGCIKMDHESQSATEPDVRPRPPRERHLPAHLADYEVQLPYNLHSEPPPADASSQRASRQSRHASRSISTGTVSSSSRSHRSARRRSPRHGLSNLHAAMLEARLKSLDLEELQRQIEEDAIVDKECERLDAQARDAQLKQEQANKARELLAKQVETRRRLKKVQNELEAAKYVCVLLKQEPQDVDVTNVQSSLTTDPLSEVSTQQNRVAVNDDYMTSTHVMPSHTSRHVNFAPVSSVIAPSVLSAVHSTDPVSELSFSSVTSVAEVTHCNTVTWSSTPLTKTQSYVMPKSEYGVPLPSNPTVARPHHYSDTSVTYSQTQAIAPLTSPVASGVAFHSPSYTDMNGIPQLTPGTLYNTPRGQAVLFPTPVQSPGMEMLAASAYGIPKPAIPYFDTGQESDFALLKMALDNVMNNQLHLSEHYKYQVLLSHLKLPSALQLAKAYMHDPRPYTTALQALQDKYGQPRQLVQSELGIILNTSAVKFGDAEAFDAFSLSIQSLVGMLRTLEGPNGYELRCGSHVDRLLSKMPPSYRDGFVEFCFSRGILQTGTDRTYTLPDLSEWLQMKSQAKRISNKAATLYQTDTARPVKKDQQRAMPSRPKERSTSILYSANGSSSAQGQQKSYTPSKIQPYCPYCNNKEHFLNACPTFKTMNTEQITQWISKEKRCWKCGRKHTSDSCTLKRTCSTCKELHLTILHDAALQIQQSVLLVNVPSPQVYLDRPNRSQKVMLKIVKVLLHNQEKVMETYAVLDDGSERSIVLSQAVKQLNLTTEPEKLTLRTVHQDVVNLHGATVSLHVSPLNKPGTKYLIAHAFTADNLRLSEHTYPVVSLQRKYEHIRSLPLPLIDRAQPLLLIGSDMPHLLNPVQPVRMGPTSAPIAICTKLGWTLQGPVGFNQTTLTTQQCFHISTTTSNTELFKNVERLWQIDTLPYINEKTATRSKQDQYAITLLQTHTTRVNVNGVMRYATPLLRRSNAKVLKAPKEAVMANLRSTERKLSKDPRRAESYCSEMIKLQQSGYVAEISTQEAEQSMESWYIPHHMVTHNNKDRIVFNCSYSYQGQALNDILLPGPVLGPSLLGVLLRFREYPVAISGDVKGMFHQVRLLPSDKPITRFLWRDMQRTEQPKIYEWQVLPFGTTCSPCCAIYALQETANNHPDVEPVLARTVKDSFYVDNCLHSLPTVAEARALVDDLRQLLLTCGFELRQWASNRPEVIQHLPSDARSPNSELWLSQKSTDLLEGTLGLLWNCLSDSFSYKPSQFSCLEPTLRNIYKVLASQYDPLGYLIPFTTRAKVLIQDLWKDNVGWDDLIKSDHLFTRWQDWQHELQSLNQIAIPRCYTSFEDPGDILSRDLHIFCDASERAYGSVAYMRTENNDGHVHVSFVLARSRVAPRKQMTIPRLELSAALIGAQVAKLLQTELTLNIDHVTLWSDSSTVLQWLKSDSCRYKVFVGTRVAEIQSLTDIDIWRYVNSGNNPADVITRGQSLKDLILPCRWSNGPDFLHQPESCWPSLPAVETEPESELKKSAICLNVCTSSDIALPDISQYTTWTELLKATATSLHGAATSSTQPTDDSLNFISAERLLLQQAQKDSFPEEFKALASDRPLPSNSRLASLSPEFDKISGLIRVGGRLRHAKDMELDAIHPIVLDPQHSLTKLLIKDYDASLLHPGPARVFAELRRRYWILRGRESIKRHQYTCIDCQKWRAKPNIPKMADLPPARLRLYKPPFYSTGMDCFGPFTVKIGRRNEKRWGIVFKCLTTRCLHLDLLESIDTDAFLMSLRRFIARRGKPFELLSDNGTNFVGGDTEMRTAYEAMTPDLKQQLAEQQISFRFNPPSAPHFGGAWEREVKSVKQALKVVLKDQTVSETVLRTILTEAEGILNAKPLGYTSSDVADPDPITPNILLMGRHDSSLPQVLYDSSNLLGTRRWKHSQVLVDHFWARFIRYYLPNLQERQKWRKEGGEISVDQVVLIVDPQLPRACWPVGRVTKTFPGLDGRIRTVEVQVHNRTYVRPVSRIVSLPKLNEDDTIAPTS
ncbi:uncharacterized protein [Misgurnus anguillicaudatus]|uniref:uncharacterized protein n=1 Tax=Misgurnus anguillicaudatus TaxID=75329 RepID=UPI003CCFDE43